MKQRILIVYPHMAIGGSTTSLLSILNLIDYEKYDIDLLLGENKGELLGYIPSCVRHLDQALPSKTALKIKKTLNFEYLLARLKVKNKSINVQYQYLNYQNAKLSRKLNDSYDIAIAFLETYSCDYVADFVNAKKKIFWLHLDYLGAGFDKNFDYPIYKQFNNIVLVSEACKKNFDITFPEFASRSVVIENILSMQFMLNRSREACDLQIDSKYLNLISVCRIDFKHKGLDRGIEAIKFLRDCGVNNVRWYIIGTGDDIEKLHLLIKDYQLEDRVFLLGAKVNPAPFIVKMGAFFLPSRYEGKPMAVTEAMMLGIPPIVAQYASASEQIENEQNGFILDNDQESINNGLLRICMNQNMIQKCRKELQKIDLSNISEMEKIYGLINKN